MAALASSHMHISNQHRHIRPSLTWLKLLFFLTVPCLPATFAQSLYSPCSQACIVSQDTAFNVPNSEGAIANNAAVCNNEAYLKATAQCIYQECGEQDLSVTIGLFISACTTTDTPTSYTSQQLIAFGEEGASSVVSTIEPGTADTVHTSSAIVATSVPPEVITSSAPAVATTSANNGHTPVQTIATTSSAFNGPTESSSAPAGMGASSTGTFSPGGYYTSSGKKLSGGAIAGIVIGSIIALALVALVVFLLLRNKRKRRISPESPAVADESGRAAGNNKAEMDGESKPVGAVSYIPVSSQDKLDIAAVQEISPTSPASMLAELDQHRSASATQHPYLSGSVTSPHQELPAYYAPHFEMPADTPAMLHAEGENNSTHIQGVNSQSPTTEGGATISSISAGTGVMRAPDEELAWLEAEEEKIRKRKSELMQPGGGVDNCKLDGY